MGRGAGVGVLVGLFAPPLFASVLVAAAAGMLVAKFADHGVKSSLQHEVGEALARGTGVVLVVIPPGSEHSVEQVLVGSPSKSVVRMEESTINSLEAAVTEAMGHLHPDAPAPGAVSAGTTGTSS
jgi:uncharacterized membrane protein